MGKCVFKEYSIMLHGKNYSILIPANDIREMWIELWANGYKNSGWNYAVLNRDAFQYLKAAYIALNQDPFKIVYFPISNIEHVLSARYTRLSPDLVLYTHQIQLNRKKWKKIKQCMRYIKPKQYVVRYNMAALYQEYDIMMQQWKKSKTFYRYKGWYYRDQERLFYQHETCFVETSRKLSLTAVIDIEKALKRDLETDLEERQYLNYTAGALRGAISYEFGTKAFLQRREAQNWQWITEEEREK